MSKPQQKRGHFTSPLGFVLAAAGSAIGLGNLWKFPYVAGSTGGGWFLLFYLIFIVVLGVPILISEMAIGRGTQLSAIGAYHKINKRWTFVGVIGVVCSFVILSYYSVVGGWVLKYMAAYITGANLGENTAEYFARFISRPVEPAIWHLVFMAFCAVVVIGGVVKGIEKVSRILLPCLFVLVVVVALRSVTLPNAIEGLRFLFVPKAETVNSFSALAQSIVAAMGQVFFSLSLGLGITITYGSYLKKESDLIKNSAVILTLDTIIAILAGVAILPAVFSFGFRPTAGPGLVFETLPAVFASMPFGKLFGLLFFFLVFIAAATSAIALLEVVSAFFIDNYHWSRKNATIIMAAAMAGIGVFASLSFGLLGGIQIAGMNLFDALGFFTDKILMPLSAFFMCLFVGHIWGIDAISREIEIGAARGFRQRALYGVVIRYVAPVLILIIFIIGLLPA